jgi:ATP-binding cassette subfamily D (ALD) protein 3
MANVFSTLAQGTKKPLSGVLVVSLIYAIYKAKKQFKLNINRGDKNSPQQQPNKKKQHKKVGVNADFFEQMKKLLPICVPGKAF